MSSDEDLPSDLYSNKPISKRDLSKYKFELTEAQTDEQKAKQRSALAAMVAEADRLGLK